MSHDMFVPIKDPFVPKRTPGIATSQMGTDSGTNTIMIG